jgi:tetratricopeptide (TPR) repeat protein
VEGPWLTDSDRVRDRVERALAIAQDYSNEAEIAFCLWALGFTYMDASMVASNYDKALSYFEQSFTIYQTLKDRFYQAQLLQDIGHSHRRCWRVGQALSYVQQSLKLREEMADKIGQGHCLRELGWAAFFDGNAAEAENCWQQACTIRREMEDRQGIADSIFTLGLLALTQGDWIKGQKLVEEALKIAQDIGSNLHTRWAVRGLEVAASMAATKLPTSSLISLNTLNKFEAILFHLIFSQREDTINEKQLQLALKEASHDLDKVKCLPFAAMDLVNKGEPERAVSLLALAYQYPDFATGWMEKLPMIQRFRANLEATLPPDIFAAAWAKGQTFSLEVGVAQLLAELDNRSTDTTILL